MALIWQEQSGGNDYQVRNAGKSIRLYRNKVFHTQYHPERIITGDIWELLLLASLNLPQHSRVLMLGVGGGAVINLLQHFEKPQRFDVADLDKTMLDLCERYFLNPDSKVQLHHAKGEALVEKLLSRKRPPQFDLIIDDAFGELAGEPIKAIEFNRTWLTCLSQLLTPTGRVVVNFESANQLKSSLSELDTFSLGYQSAIRLSSPRYQNNILSLSKSPLSTSDIRDRILEEPLLRKHQADYFMRKIML